MEQEKKIDQFEKARPRLMGLAYRMLGSVGDAEDAVQETGIKWLSADTDGIRSPDAWLTTVCSRYCLDQLKSAERKRVQYVGTWLPEPVAADGEDDHQLASTLSTAFLLLLDRLTPKERAAYLMHELFEQSYEETADALSLSEATCRKLVSRAKFHIGQERRRFEPRPQAQEKLLTAFEAAIATGDPEGLSLLLSDEAELGADGGGKVIAVPHILAGKPKILPFVARALRKAWQHYDVQRMQVNGANALVYRDTKGIGSVVSVECNEKGIGTHIYIMRNPEKLARISRVVRLI